MIRLSARALVVMESGIIPNNTISALTQLLGDGVSLVNDEVLVEDLENFSSL